MISFALFATWATIGLNAANHYWHGLPNTCPKTFVSVVADGGSPEAGNYREPGFCIVWINTTYGPYSGPVMCKLIIHEVGHLRGLQHSTSPRSVMYTPFHEKPIPRGCRLAKSR